MLNKNTFSEFKEWWNAAFTNRTERASICEGFSDWVPPDNLDFLTDFERKLCFIFFIFRGASCLIESIISNSACLNYSSQFR